MFDNDCKEVFLFDHSKRLITEALGISRERTFELLGVFREINHRVTRESKTLQEIVNSDKLNNCEKIFMVYILGKEAGRADSLNLPKDFANGIGIMIGGDKFLSEDIMEGLKAHDPGALEDLLIKMLMDIRNMRKRKE